MPSGPKISDSNLSLTSVAPARVAHPVRVGRILPIVVVLFGWTLSMWVFVLLERAASQREQEFFGERVAEAQSAISVRMTHYIDALHSGASFFAAAEFVTRDGWRDYAEALRLRKRYPGINGLGIILAVPSDGIEAWKARMRTSDGVEPKILPFPASQEGPPDAVKYLITFVEGDAPNPAPIGRNIATDPSRRRAAELARDTGKAQINHRIPGSRDTQRRAGLILYVPLYIKGAEVDTVEERRAALLGWVYAQVYPDEFLDGVLGPMGQALRLHFFESGDLTRKQLLYASGGVVDGPLPTFERVTEMTLAGERFQLGWQRGPRFPVADKLPAIWATGSLAIATLLLAGLITSLQSVGRRAHAIAAVRTSELAASEERFRQAFESAGIGMALVALDGRWLRVNRSFCEIVGYSEARLLHKTFQDITHPDDLAADLRLIGDLVEGRRRFYQLEKRYIHREGHMVIGRLTGSLVRDALGEPLHIVLQIEDVTERKQLELNLAKARDEALEASRFKSEFLATMIDEIRMPMNDVMGVTRHLRDTSLTPSQGDAIQTIEAAGDSLLTVINDILDFSRIEAGQIELEIETFDLRACVNAILALFAERARLKDIKLEATIATRVPAYAAADARRLQQILINLVNNAIKRTEAGEVRVNLTAEALDATTGRQRLKFAVRDTGVGMPPDEIDRLFKSFSKIDASTRRLGATGLGLAISKRLAELMDGTMWTQSEPGRGSTFHFTVVVEPRDVNVDPSSS